MYPHEILPVTWTPGYALLLFSMWWLMMIAMMLPSAAPMVLLHAAVTRKGLARANDAGPNAPSHRLHSTTTAFIAGYLAMWGAFSLVAVVAQWALERGELLSAMMMSTSKLLGSGLLLAAGVWQLTPFKTVCLRHCRSRRLASCLRIGTPASGAHSGWALSTAYSA
jgi:predicted metal-binding membrane protein